MPTTETRTSEATTHTSSGGRLVAADGRELVLRDLRLRVDAGGGIARTVLEQHFANPYDTPLAITYQLPLPADGAVSAFAFLVGEERIEGRIDRRESARRQYEEALLQGRTAAILDQERSSLFTQEIGNVPPGSAVVAEIAIDQKLRWLVGEGSWEWRFPTVVAPRYLGAEGRVADAERVTVDVVEAAPPAAIGFALAVRDALADGGAPRSPSHAIVSAAAEGRVEVTLAAESGAPLDRDLVVRWAVATASIGTRIEVARPVLGDVTSRSGYGLLTLVPPAAATRSAPRDLVVLLDASGSMSGLPLEQAKAVTAALIRSLDDGDSLELIAFASLPLRFRAGPEIATDALCSAALEWLAKLDAGGGTEMDRAVATALAPLRDGVQRQVVLVTDGSIGFEQEIVSRVLTALPRTSRLHAVGVGPAVNRSLTATAARAGRGVEVVIGLDENGEDAALRLLAHLDVPIAIEVEVGGSALRSQAPAQLRDLALGAPVLVAVELDPAGGDLVVRGDDFETQFRVPAIEPGSGNGALAKLFARERVEDLEMRAAGGEQVDAEIETTGLDFAIATRLTSWVAVSDGVAIDSRLPSRRARIPQRIPAGLALRTLGLSRERSGMRFGISMAAEFSEAIEEVEAPAFRRSSRDASTTRSELRSRRRRDRIRGRLVTARDGELVIEFEVEGASLNWAPSELVYVSARRLRTRETAATLDANRSTMPSRIEAGQIVRLVLRLAGPIRGRIQSLRLDNAGEEFVIELEA